jgi:hypothetical protein
MKKFLTLVLVVFTSQLFAQNNPITSINISLPANPDANTANWGSGTSLLTITANAKATAGRVDPIVTESKILVIIKKNGSKICGTYTSSTAPASGFNSLIKAWSGNNAVSLLGQDCTLPPGDYELSVQFFGYGAAKMIAISDEKTKPFTIRGNEQQAYQPPQLIMPANSTVFKQTDIVKPITFRWLSVMPKPNAPITYRLKVWQLMQGQNGTQALRANQPIFTKDVDNLTQATVTGLITGPCKPPYLCDFAWNVQALNREGKPVGGSNGTGDTFIFSYHEDPVQEVNPAISLNLPANGANVAAGEAIQFKWNAAGVSDKGTYKITIVELKGNESPEAAFRTNKPIFERDSMLDLSFKTNKPIFEKDSTLDISSPPVFEPGKKYAWRVDYTGPGSVAKKGITIGTKPFVFGITGKVVGTLSIKGIWPAGDCPITEARPVFKWEVKDLPKNAGEILHELTLVQMAESDTTLSAFDKKKLLLVKSGIKEDNFKFPETSAALVMGKIYAWRVKTFQKGRLLATSQISFFFLNTYRLPYGITTALCCTTTSLINGSFQDGNVPGVLDTRGTVTGWHTGYGSPVVSSNADGNSDPGYVQLQGNKASGSSITQTLPAATKIIQGKHYRVSLSVRLKKSLKNSKYVLVKVIAYNGTLPTTGIHPVPSANLAIVGFTGKLTLDAWGSTSLGVWIANKNFDKVAVYCYTNSNDTTAICDVDNICFAETKDPASCGDYAYNSMGQPIIDTSIAYHARDTTYNYYDEFTGTTADLYGQLGNTSLDTWYPSNDPCSSIGGFVPPEVQNINFADTLHHLGYPGSPQQLDSVLSQTFTDTSRRVLLLPIPAPAQCNKPVVLDNTQPFGGRDLIFVHGLQLKHLCDRHAGVSGAMANWPVNPAEFYAGGYYKKIAESGWADHIKTWITSKGYKNRYIIIAYNCSQPLAVATHAMLKQIRDAMSNGTGVVVQPGDPRGKECFGKNSVIISHSTGGLVSDVAMSIAEKSKTNPAIQAIYGNVGYIADNVKAHIAFHPVLEGSKMATVFLATQVMPGISTLLNSQICGSLSVPSPLMLLITHTSVLIDLQPAVVRTVWAPFINSSPVPTITVAGGHPYGVDGVGYLNWAIHPGLDDGVSTMSSQSGNPNFETGLKPSGYFRSTNPFRVYDMGIPSQRANSYYMNQTLFTLPGYIGGSAVTHLSATGMLQPVSSVDALSNPENRYNNHYSFLQSASDHYKGPRGKSLTEGFDPNNFPATSGYVAPNYDYDPIFGKRNYEESRAITDMDIYNKGLVSPLMSNMQGEHVRGLYITIAIPIPNMSIKYPPLKFKFWWSYYYISIPVWERKYHNLIGYESEDECSYVYKYVLR